MATTRPQPALVLPRTTVSRAPVKQALVDALIGAVLDELGGVDVARITPAATKTAPRQKDLHRERRGMR